MPRFSVLLSCSYNPQLVDTSDVVLYEIDAVRAMEPQGPAFNQGLRQGYLDYSDVMTVGIRRTPTTVHFAFKAVDSAKGEMVLPGHGSSRAISPPDNVEELSAARARLMAALDQTGRKKAPWDAAKAQTAFDCWLERSRRTTRPTEIQVCKGAVRDRDQRGRARAHHRGRSLPRVLRLGSGRVSRRSPWRSSTRCRRTSCAVDPTRRQGRGPRRPVRLGGVQRPAVGARARNVARALMQRGVPEQSLAGRMVRRTPAAHTDARWPAGAA